MSLKGLMDSLGCIDGGVMVSTIVSAEEHDHHRWADDGGPPPPEELERSVIHHHSEVAQPIGLFVMPSGPREMEFPKLKSINEAVGKLDMSGHSCCSNSLQGRSGAIIGGKFKGQEGQVVACFIKTMKVDDYTDSIFVIVVSLGCGKLAEVESDEFKLHPPLVDEAQFVIAPASVRTPGLKGTFHAQIVGIRFDKPERVLILRDIDDRIWEAKASDCEIFIPTGDDAWRLRAKQQVPSEMWSLLERRINWPGKMRRSADSPVPTEPPKT